MCEHACREDSRCDERLGTRKSQLGSNRSRGKHETENWPAHLRPAVWTAAVGQRELVEGFVFLVCKAIRRGDSQKLHSFEILAASGDPLRAVDGARQIFCEMTRLQVNYQQYFSAQNVI